MYQLLPKTILGEPNCVRRLADGTFVPIEPTNIDYQEYAAWLAAGNTPLPADTQE